MKPGILNSMKRAMRGAAPGAGETHNLTMGSSTLSPATTRALVAALAIVLVAWGCASGTAQTTEGPRPASTVQAQDLVADILKTLRTAHTQAVQLHDSRANVDDPVLHRQHRQLLLDTGTALNASWRLLAAWKAQTQDAAPSDILAPLLAAGPSFCDLAVSFGILKPEQADKLKAFLAAIPAQEVPR